MLETRKVHLHSALKQGDTRLGGAAGNWLRSVLVGVQVGLSLVLLVGARRASGGVAVELDEAATGI